MVLNWKFKKIGEVCTVVAGQSPEGKFYNKVGKGLPFYQGKKDFTIKFIASPTVWTTKVTKEAIAGDILMSVRAPVGPVNFSTGKLCIGRGLAAIRAGEEIDKDFLFNFLQMHENKIVGNSGAVFASISKTQIENIEIPVPPLPEQHHIVAVLDEIFSKISKAKENAEKNLQNAKELFESYLQNVFANPGEDWEERRLEDVCDFQNGFAFKSNSFKEKGLPILRISNIQNNVISYKRLVFFDKNSYKENFDKYQVKKGDLVIAMSGATTGKLAVSDADEVFYLNQRVGKFLPKKELLKDYLYYLLSTRIEENLKISSGTAQPNLSTEQIKAFQVPLPSLPIQKSIVARLDALSSETKKLEAIYKQKLADLDELKKSVLRKAFAGEL